MTLKQTPDDEPPLYIYHIYTRSSREIKVVQVPILFDRVDISNSAVVSLVHFTCDIA